MAKKKPKTSHAIQLAEDALKVSEIEETRQLLLESFEQAPSLALDLSAVEECDTAGLQLLVSALKYAVQLKKDVTIEKESAAVRGAFQNAGLPFDAAFGVQAKEI